jgi:hypothetical protein
MRHVLGMLLLLAVFAGAAWSWHQMRERMPILRMRRRDGRPAMIDIALAKPEAREGPES